MRGHQCQWHWQCVPNPRPVAGTALLALAPSPAAPFSSRGKEGDEQGDTVVCAIVPEECE